MENGGRGRKSRRTQRRAPQGLGKRGLEAFRKNKTSVNGFIDELDAHTLDLTRFSVGRVDGPAGDSRFNVTQLPSGTMVESAGIAGFLERGTPASGTYIDRGSVVIMYDSRSGRLNRGRTHTIIGVLAPYQADYVFHKLGILLPGVADDLFEREGEAEAARAELANVEHQLAALRRSVAATGARSSSSNAGSAAASRKSSSSSYNVEAEMAAVAAALKRAKKTEKFHSRKAKKAAKKAAEATGAGGGGSATWF
jgi:hypothetical protein